MSSKNACESCLMPFSQDPLGDKRENPKYCSYCFKDGKFTYEGDLTGFKENCYKAMRKNGMGFLKAKFFTFLVGFAPRWKK